MEKEKCVSKLYQMYGLICLNWSGKVFFRNDLTQCAQISDRDVDKTNYKIFIKETKK